MDEKLLHARQVCMNQAQGFIDAADHLGGGGWPHIVYHLSLLALEEIGKASMLGARMVSHSNLDGSWIDRSLDRRRSARNLHRFRSTKCRLRPRCARQ